MHRIDIPQLESATGAAAGIFERIRSATGSIPNCFEAVGLVHPAALKAILQADGVLATSLLTTQELEIVKLVVSEIAGCDYCISSHSVRAKDAGASPDALIAILGGRPTGNSRKDALIRLVRTLMSTRGSISDADFADIKSAGISDAQIVDICLAIAVTTFTNAFNRINDTPMDALTSV